MMPQMRRSVFTLVVTLSTAILGISALVTLRPAGDALAAVAPGAALYAAKCAVCHGAQGQGTTSAVYSAPALAHSADVTAANPKKMISIIVNGMSGPVVANGQKYDGVMPPWKGQLSSADVALVTTYIRSSWGNHAPPVTVHDVTMAGSTVMSMVGSSIYSARCALCHGANGRGRSGIPSLVHNGRVTSDDPSTMILAIEYGGTNMPAWRGQLSDADVAAVATYIRSSWGNKASPVTDGDVVSVSAK